MKFLADGHAPYRIHIDFVTDGSLITKWLLCKKYIFIYVFIHMALALILSDVSSFNFNAQPVVYQDIQVAHSTWWFIPVSKWCKWLIARL